MNQVVYCELSLIITGMQHCTILTLQNSWSIQAHFFWYVLYLLMHTSEFTLKKVQLAVWLQAKQVLRETSLQSSFSNRWCGCLPSSTTRRHLWLHMAVQLLAGNGWIQGADAQRWCCGEVSYGKSGCCSLADMACTHHTTANMWEQMNYFLIVVNKWTSTK